MNIWKWNPYGEDYIALNGPNADGNMTLRLSDCDGVTAWSMPTDEAIQLARAILSATSESEQRS